MAAVAVAVRRAMRSARVNEMRSGSRSAASAARATRTTTASENQVLLRSLACGRFRQHDPQHIHRSCPRRRLATISPDQSRVWWVGLTPPVFIVVG